MAAGRCENNFIATGKDGCSHPEGIDAKPVISEEEFGAGICDSVYQSRTWKGMEKLFQQEKLSDIILMAEGQSIPCHKFLLASASDYFYNKLTRQTEDIEHNLLEVDIGFQTLRVIVSYLYTGHINATIENGVDVIQACKMLNLNSASDLCVQFLLKYISPSNCLSFHKFARTHDIQNLKEKAEEVMHDFSRAISDLEFYNMSVDDVEEYIENDNINIPCEDLVFQAVVFWIRHHPETRESCFSRLVKHVRLRFCSMHYLTWVVAKDPLMENIECYRLVVAALSYKKSNDSVPTCEFDGADYIASPRKSYATGSTLIVGGGMSIHEGINSRCWYWEDHVWRLNEGSAMPKKLELFSACTVKDWILISGGYTHAGGDLKPITECWLLCTSNLQWNVVPDLNIARARHASVCGGGQPYVIGGAGYDGDLLSSVERLSDVNGRWDKMPDLPRALCHTMAVAFQQLLFVFGGAARPKTDTSLSAYVFRLEQGEWQTLPSMPTFCSFGGAVVFKDKIYIVGGFEQSCLCFDPVLTQWSALSQCQYQHADAPALVWKGNILVCGGRTNMANQEDGKAGETSVVEEYDPGTDTWLVSHIQLPCKLHAHFIVCGVATWCKKS